MKLGLALSVLLFSFVNASAQSTMDEIEASIAARAQELNRAEKILTSPDPNQRKAAMEMLLKQDDPALVNKAKEVGLYSADPELRATAIRAILDAGGAFRAEFDIPSNTDNLTAVYDWLRTFKGSWSVDGRTGYFQFALGSYDAAEMCWKWLGSRNCALRMSGESVSTADWDFNISGSAVMKLDDTGALNGSFLVNGRGRPVTIRIPLHF